MCKYADDTYIIIAASNKTTRHVSYSSAKQIIVGLPAQLPRLVSVLCYVGGPIRLLFLSVDPMPNTLMFNPLLTIRSRLSSTAMT